MDIQQQQEILKKAGFDFQPGLTDQEINQIETCFKFKFPPDYRAFLAAGLPVSGSFVDWRNEPFAKLQESLAWPLEGMYFDIEYNGFWLSGWGKRPENLDAAFSIARQAFEQAPKLIPIYSHRYIPATPEETGNPVFSVYQMDIIYFGRDFNEYLENEFGHYFFGKGRFQVTDPIKHIPFWSDFA